MVARLVGDPTAGSAGQTWGLPGVAPPCVLSLPLPRLGLDPFVPPRPLLTLALLLPTTMDSVRPQTTAPPPSAETRTPSGPAGRRSPARSKYAHTSVVPSRHACPA